MAAQAALEIMETEPEHVEQLWDNGLKMLNGLRELGFNTGNTQTPIVPYHYRWGRTNIADVEMLFERGVYTNPVVPPGVPEGQGCCEPAIWRRIQKNNWIGR